MCHNRFTTSPLPVSQVFLHPADSLRGRQPPAKGIGHLRGDRAGLGSSQDQIVSYRNSALQHMQIHSDSKFTSSKKRSSKPDRGKIKSVNIYTAETVFLGAFCSPGAGGFYCFAQCLRTRNSPHTQTHRFRVPTVLLWSAISSQGHIVTLREEEKQRGNHLKR